MQASQLIHKKSLNASAMLFIHQNLHLKVIPNTVHRINTMNSIFFIFLINKKNNIYKKIFLFLKLFL